MSEAIELFKADGTTAGIFYCSYCRIVHRTKEEAEFCHGERLCPCGKKLERTGIYQRKCDECDRAERNERERQKEADRFEKAKKITEAEYTGDHVYCGDQYYESVADAIDQYLEGQEPEYVWACSTHGIPAIDLEDCTTNIIDNMWEDADYSDLNGVEELEAALAAFNKANESIQLWEPDYSTAILVAPGAST
jgi:hypothetical protein